MHSQNVQNQQDILLPVLTNKKCTHLQSPIYCFVVFICSCYLANL